ncbi:MAG: SDR family NAD(P)-dependent oxidoreductase, partial [Ignavibacteria bacterium]
MNTTRSKPKSFPSQKQAPPGYESEMKPKPEVIRKNYKGSDKLKNKVALITGGDSGIGRSVAVHFAREGADIAIIYLNENKDALETKRMVEEEGRKCLLLAGDIRNKEFCREAVE